MTMGARIEQVEVVSVGDSRPDGTKMLVLGVTSSVDTDRVGTTFAVPMPLSCAVAVGYIGTALWMPGTQLPKLILAPGKVMA